MTLIANRWNTKVRPDSQQSVKPYLENGITTSFDVIAGSGHCGSKWLSNVLDSQPGVSFYHHFRETMTGKPWEVLDTRQPNDPIFHQYWRWMRGELGCGDVGDANSWPPHLLLEVNAVQPIGRVIYLTRNKLKQLYSLFTTSPSLQREPMPPAAEIKLRTLSEIGDYGSIDDWPRFDMICLMVAANDFMPVWLRSNGLTVDVYSLEELTADLDKLRELAPLLDDARLEKWQRTDVNKKTEDSPDPSAIWNQLTDEHRGAYQDIVGDPEI